MAKFDNLAKSFEDGAKTANVSDVSALNKSLAVINSIDKLKARGLPVTKKAQRGYLRAMRHVQRASEVAGADLLEEYRGVNGGPTADAKPKTAPAPPPAAPPKPTPLPKKTSSSQNYDNIKRNPQEHPKEFQIALQYSKNKVAEVDALKAEHKPISDKLLKEYVLCQRFLEKFK